MKNEEIKAKVDNCYQRIKEADEELKKLRESCPHNKIEKTNYEWATGHIIYDADVCAICGKYIVDLTSYIVSCDEPEK